METVDPPPQWKDLPPGEKQARLLDQALDRKREILSLRLPDESDDSAEAHRARSLVLAAADSTINQRFSFARTNSRRRPMLRRMPPWKRLSRSAGRKRSR
jgi:hypothetical protein